MLLVPVISAILIISIALLLLLLHLHRRRSLTGSINNLPLSLSGSSNAIRSYGGDTVPDEDHRLLNLPVFKFKTATAGGCGDCAVCLASFQPEEDLRLLPLCFHAFHLECIDPWLRTNQQCPICRSPVFGSESDLIRRAIEVSVGTRSFRFQLGSVSRRRLGLDSGEVHQRSYSLGSSFHYVIEQDLEVTVVPEDVQEENDGARAASFRDYSDRLLSAMSRRFVAGRSCWNEDFSAGGWDVEANRAGEEITELFRWLSEG